MLATVPPGFVFRYNICISSVSNECGRNGYCLLDCCCQIGMISVPNCIAANPMKKSIVLSSKYSNGVPTSFITCVINLMKHCKLT